ncbi:MAG: hypothetical protein K0R50_2609 [Eubacterium sp.]|jgi:uncharacterized SAM-binding protein YcdF (DUF218 family)|nr:hypothetical protein [Eubacterium sp.]
MKNYTEHDVAADLNCIISFLSRRDITRLKTEALYEKYGISQADVLMVLGSSMPYLAELGAGAFKTGLARELMLVGGIGHSTKYLVTNVLNNSNYRDIEVENRPEADILKDVISRNTDIDPDSIIIENRSANCGANAVEALRTLKAVNKVPGSIIIIQDPTMQLRTHASFLKSWAGEKTEIISFSPFIPLLLVKEDGLRFENNIDGIWSVDRFVDLIMGEIPRLRDDENGYGPKGRDFIAHVDIPSEVLESYSRLQSRYNEYNQIKLRK